MAKKAAAPAAEATKPAAEAAKPEKEVKEKLVAGKPLSAKILFGKDKEGKSYGKDNNPKRRKAGERFALYTDGMTVQKALDAGISAADIAWDVGKGFITLN